MRAQSLGETARWISALAAAAANGALDGSIPGMPLLGAEDSAWGEMAATVLTSLAQSGLTHLCGRSHGHAGALQCAWMHDCEQLTAIVARERPTELLPGRAQSMRRGGRAVILRRPHGCSG